MVNVPSFYEITDKIRTYTVILITSGGYNIDLFLKKIFKNIIINGSGECKKEFLNTKILE